MGFSVYARLRTCMMLVRHVNVFCSIKKENTQVMRGMFDKFILFSQHQGADPLKKDLADLGIEKTVHRGKIANFLLKQQKSTQKIT